jgi:thioesterase domain-containing protein
VDGLAEPLTSVENLAAYFASQIRAFRPNSPYIIVGYCAGGAIAFELARQLQQQGERVSFVALFASPHPTWYRFLPQLRYRLQQQVHRVTTHLRALSRPGRRAYVAEKLRARRARHVARREPPDPLLVLRARIEAATIRAVRDYTPRYFAGPLVLFLPTSEWLRTGNALLRWSAEARVTTTYCGPDGCPVDQMLREPYAVASADLFRRCVDEMAATDATQLAPTA